MKYSIFTWFGYDLPIKERLDLIKSTGFDAVMLWWGFDDRHLSNTYAREIGLQVENAHLMYYNVDDLWVNKNGVFTKEIINSINECADANISKVVMHINDFRTNPNISKIGLNNFQSILSCAEKNNIKNCNRKL